MNMRGFNAEASLYGMSRHYGHAGLSSARTMLILSLHNNCADI
jgi:hypothetical protein